MKRVKMLTGMAGRGFAYEPGQEVEMDPNTAMRLIAAGAAAPVGPAKAVWDMRITPVEYLERFPNGPNAKRARELIDGPR
jgi:hypothetical protein